VLIGAAGEKWYDANLPGGISWPGNPEFTIIWEKNLIWENEIHSTSFAA
jgi:hypothetical protein